MVSDWPLSNPKRSQCGVSAALSSIACALLFAVGFESFVESDCALRSVPVERQSEKDLRWNTFMHKFRDVCEPEFSVVVRMPNETASSSIHVSKP